VRLPELAGIEDALKRIRPYLPATPLIRSELLSRALHADVWLKNETVSPVASFKLRGALTELLRAREAGEVVAAVTSSTGNQARASPMRRGCWASPRTSSCRSARTR
jgi:threonine dehydratase